MVTTKEDIINRINQIIPEDADENTIALLEDVTDTFNAFENSANTDYELKYNTLMKKYRDRFTGEEGMNDRELSLNASDRENASEKTEKRTYEDLFLREV